MHMAQSTVDDCKVSSLFGEKPLLHISSVSSVPVKQHSCKSMTAVRRCAWIIYGVRCENHFCRCCFWSRLLVLCPSFKKKKSNKKTSQGVWSTSFTSLRCQHTVWVFCICKFNMDKNTFGDWIYFIFIY